MVVSVSSTTRQVGEKRKRGVILTAKGLQKFQIAIQKLEASEVDGRLTLEKLSEHIKVSTKTLSRLWSSDLGVDRKTLKLCFSALNLELDASDYALLNPQTKATQPTEEVLFSSSNSLKTHFPYSALSGFSQNQVISPLNLSYPDGPVGLDSPFYIERPPIESLAYQEIVQPNCMIRIQAPRGMGKSSLVLRLLAFAKMQEYRVAMLDCRQFDSSCLTNLGQFLRCFCLSVAKALGVEPQLDQYWDEDIGDKLSCSFYFKTYLLKQIDCPVLLVLSDVNRLFRYPQIVEQFSSLLCSWYEETCQNATLQKLRLAIVYSTEEYPVLDVDRSPFNVGLPLHLTEFSHLQVHDLAQRYGLNWSMAEVNQLMVLLGGHPLLTQIALYHIRCEEISLEQLLRQSINRGGIFQAHLWRLWLTLHKDQDLVDALESVVQTKHGTFLDPIQTCKLENQGLIYYEGTLVKLRCELYRAYFKQQFQLSHDAQSVALAESDPEYVSHCLQR